MRLRDFGSRRFLSTLVLLLPLVAGTAAPVRADQPAVPAVQAKESQPKVEELWYTVTISGQRAGWSRDTTTTTDSRITHDQELSFTIRREGQGVTISSRTTFVETPAHAPISMRLIQAMGADPTDTLYEFKPDGVQVTTSTKSGRQSTMLPRVKEEWLTPGAVETLVKAKQKAGEKSFSYRTLDPSTGVSVVTETREGTGRGTVSIGGRDVDVVRYSVKNSSAQGLSMSESVDEQGDLVVQEINTGALTIVLTRSTEAQARGSFEAPEVMVSTYIVPEHPVQRPRSLESASYVLWVPDGEAPKVATTGSQRSTALEDRRVRVEIAAGTFAPAVLTDAERQTALAATTLADTRDEKIRALVSRATRGAADTPPARAEAMRRFVHRFIKNKDLSVGFASASETARSGEGDCTEHGVLLAAMLRADQIPSRVVSGLIYASGIAQGKGAFAYHLWTQALLTIDGQERWVDLDATLPDGSPFDAAHIALVISDLSDTDTMTSMVSIVPLLGRLKIEVVSTDTKAKESSDAK